MGFILEDGKGQGYKAQIDNEGNLHALATTESLLAHRSHYDQTAFGISTPMLTITTTGGRMLFIKNLSSTLEFYITDFWFNWNGGSTNFNRPCYGELAFGDTVPDTNTTTSEAGNLNLGSANTADLTVLYWDEIGDGMTGHTAGNTAMYWTFNKNPAHYMTDGAFILGTHNTISMNLKGEETGEGSINMLGFMKER